MSARKGNSKELIRHSLNDMKKVIENDTEIFLHDVNLIQQMNTNESLKLVRLQEKVEVIVKESAEIKKSNDELRNFNTKLSKLEKQTDTLEQITKELDEWTKELEVKAQRMKASGTSS